MTSLFTGFVAQGIEVPEIDPRIASHIDICEVISAEERPAAQADVLTDVNAPVEASDTALSSSTHDGTTIPT